MGLTIQKTKSISGKDVKKEAAKAKHQPAALPSGAVLGHEKEVDRLQELAEKLAPVRAMIKEEADLEKKLRAVGDAAVPADQKATIMGVDAHFIVSEKTLERSIVDMHELRKAMGDALFMECANVTLKDIDKYLDAEQKSKVLVETRTGRRKGNLVEV